MDKISKTKKNHFSFSFKLNLNEKNTKMGIIGKKIAIYVNLFKQNSL